MQATVLDLTLIVVCRICHEDHFIEVTEKDFEAWQQGTLIQVALPYLAPENRELLISNICPTCFQKLFGDEE